MGNKSLAGNLFQLIPWSLVYSGFLLESILIIFMFLENQFHLDSQIYWQRVKQPFPQAFTHNVYQNESQWHNAKGNSIKTILWGTKTKIFQAVALSWFSFIQE